jgi:hypothetical protein
MSLSQEAETGGAALHDKWQSGYTCSAVMAKNRCLVDNCGDHSRTTDELHSTISIGEGSVMVSIEKLAYSTGCVHQVPQMLIATQKDQESNCHHSFCTNITMT